MWFLGREWNTDCCCVFYLVVFVLGAWYSVCSGGHDVSVKCSTWKFPCHNHPQHPWISTVVSRLNFPTTVSSLETPLVFLHWGMVRSSSYIGDWIRFVLPAEWPSSRTTSTKNTLMRVVSRILFQWYWFNTIYWTSNMDAFVNLSDNMLHLLFPHSSRFRRTTSPASTWLWRCREIQSYHAASSWHHGYAINIPGFHEMPPQKKGVQ